MQIQWFSAGFLLLFVRAPFREVAGLDCFPQICGRNPANYLRDCTSDKPRCAMFDEARPDGRYMQAVDLKCGVGQEIYAPFAGKVEFYRPFRNYDCLDTGVRIYGVGIFEGYVASLSPVIPLKYSGSVNRSQIIGRSINSTCQELKKIKTDMQILQFELTKSGEPIDPYYFLKDCYCINAVCETNPSNTLIGTPFGYKAGFGRGYEMNCPDPSQEVTGNQKRKAYIYAPIRGTKYGRLRPRATDNTNDYACENDAVFIEGAHGWNDYVVHIYNVKLAIPVGLNGVIRGARFATVLDCGNNDNTIFMEVRYQGRLINMTDMVSGNCKRPESIFPTLVTSSNTRIN